MNQSGQTATPLSQGESLRRKAAKRGSALLLLFVSSIVAALPWPLSAGPVVRLEAADATAFPRVDLLLSIAHPYPEREKAQASITVEQFRLIEKSYKSGDDIAAQILSVSDVKPDAELLYTILVVDSTLSVDPQPFERSLTIGEKLIDSMRDGDAMALFRIDGEPILHLGISQDESRLHESLNSIPHDGRMTRIYDTLHSALWTARNIEIESRREGETLGESRLQRTVVVMLTDGIDEGSLLSEEDALSLADLGMRYRIPIYIIVHSPYEDSDRLDRIVRRTGGALWVDPQSGELDDLATRLRFVPQRLYRLSYQSRLTGETLPRPGSRIELLLSYQSEWSDGYDSSSYRLDLRGFLRQSLAVSKDFRINPLLWLSGGILTLALLFALLVLLLSSRRERQLGQEPDHDPLSDHTVPVANRIAPRHVHVDSGTLPPAVAAMPEEAVAVNEHDDRVSIRDSVSDLDSERGQFLRDYQQRMLQNALREGVSYPQGAALTLLGEGRYRVTMEYDLVGETVVIGSGRWANIHLTDRSVSASHARIRRAEDKFILYDLASSSGVYLNHKKILRPRALSDGDTIRIGNTRFLFQGR